MKEVRLGTIGSGFIVQTILRNVGRTEGIRLQAVYSRSRERGQALADEFGGQTVYTDLDAFLRDPELDVVYIATPNLLHYPQAKQALEAGKHVILEKPFTTRAAHARELVELARAKGLLLVEAAPTSFLPNFAVLRDALGKIGEVRLVLSNYSQYSSRYDRLVAGEVPNIFNPAFAGGSLMDINFYNIYLTVALFGKPRRAEYRPNLYRGKYDTSGVMTMAYPGFTAVCAGAKDTWGVNAYQIEGTQGHIYVEGGSNGLSRVRVVTKSGEESTSLQPDPDRWFYEVQALARLFREENPEPFARRQEITLAVVETMEAARTQAGLHFPGDPDWKEAPALEERGDYDRDKERSIPR